MVKKLPLKSKKKEYKIDETISLIYEVDASIDSVGKLENGDFEVVMGPSKTSSFSMLNNVPSYTFTLKYRISPNFPGKQKIKSPLFFIDGKVLRAKDLKLNIANDRLTAKEQEEIEFNKFRNGPKEIQGTLRYIVSDTFGYIEKYYDDEWQFQRRLTTEELQNLQKQ